MTKAWEQDVMQTLQDTPVVSVTTSAANGVELQETAAFSQTDRVRLCPPTQTLVA